jgi:F-type H+-transporting ATPase subunit delta
MKYSEATAKSYARALFELARERNQVDAIASELAQVASVLAEQAALREFLSRPWVSAAAKRGAAAEVAQRLGVSRLMRDFLALLAVRNRTDHVPAIEAAFRRMMDEAMGRVRVKVRTAVALTEAERGALRARLARVLESRELILEETVDGAMLGGFVAEVGSTILDGSLDTQLERMRDRLARA